MPGSGGSVAIGKDNHKQQREDSECQLETAT